MAVFLNGIIADFATTLRGPIVERIGTDNAAEIRGYTDAEYLFALLRQFARENPGADGVQLLAQLVDFLSHIANDTQIALSILLSEHDRLYALRHSLNMSFPTLYYCENFNDGVAIASEPLHDRRHWKLMPEASILTVDATQTLTLSSVAS